jgi:hypothetical protein
MEWLIFFMIGLFFLGVEIFSIANKSKVKKWNEEKRHPQLFLAIHFFYHVWLYVGIFFSAQFWAFFVLWVCMKLKEYKKISATADYIISMFTLTAIIIGGILFYL